MKRLIIYECKKLLGHKIAKGTLLFACVCITALSFFFISEMTYLNLSGESVNGRTAIKLKKEVQVKLPKELSEDVLVEMFTYYQEAEATKPFKEDINNQLSNLHYAKMYQPYEDIFSLLQEVYSPIGEFDYYILNNVHEQEIVEFYHKRHEFVKNLAELRTEGDGAKIDYISDKDQMVTKPFTYGYTDNWLIVFRGFFTVFFLIGLTVTVIISPIFAYEYQTGVDAILLSAKHGRNKLIGAKFMAGFLVTSLIYLLIVVLYIGIIMGIFSFEGANASFQVFMVQSFYNLSIIEVFGYGILINYLAILSIMSTTMLLSAICKRSFTAIIISTVWLLIPPFVPSGNTMFTDFVNLLPTKVINTTELFSTYNLYNIGGKILSLPHMSILFLTFLCIVSIPIACQRFRTHQVF